MIFNTETEFEIHATILPKNYLMVNHEAILKSIFALCYYVDLLIR